MKVGNAFHMFLFLGGLSVFLVACATMGDTYFRVSGTLPDESSGVKCTLGIYSVYGNRLIDYRTVGNEFKTSFVLQAKPANYYFEVKCAGGRLYRTAAYTFGDRGTFNATVELGELQRMVSDSD